MFNSNIQLSRLISSSRQLCLQHFYSWKNNSQKVHKFFSTNKKPISKGSQVVRLKLVAKVQMKRLNVICRQGDDLGRISDSADRRRGYMYARACETSEVY